MRAALEAPALADWLAARAGARDACVDGCERLHGGAIRENWGMTATFAGGAWHGRQALVVRSAGPSAVPDSRPLDEEFALLSAAHAAGVTTPEPLWLCTDPAPAGRPFLVMRRIGGTALGRRLVGDGGPGGDGDALARRLGRELALIHGITPPRADLRFLRLPQPSPALAAVARLRRHLDARPSPHPVLEWGLRWLERHAPPAVDPVLAHRDFRTGNYMVDADGLTGILDWEFAGWSDPLEDIGWFCARCWRFGAREREAGGIAGREPFYAGYREGGGSLDGAAVGYWEVMAHLRWAVIALHQGDRHAAGLQPGLELALAGRRPAELEAEILALTGGL